MTREEAIQVLQTALTSSFIYGEYADAIDIAIKALSEGNVHNLHSGDLISREDAIEAIMEYNFSFPQYMERFVTELRDAMKADLIDDINALPSAEATVGDYPNDLISRNALMEYCSNQKSKTINNNDIARFPSADAVSREFYEDAVKANIHLVIENSKLKEQLESAEAEWIPCSERLPSDSGDYLVWLEDESEHYAVIPFDADAGGFGWWQDYYHPVSLGFLDSEFIKAENVTAWQPLPKPYREDGEV